MNYFSNWNKFYKLKPNGGQWGNHLSGPDSHVERFFSIIPVKSNSCILDSGCADGKNSAYINSLGHTVYGIDVSKSVINRVSENVKGNFSVQDCKETSFTNNKFDAIVDAGCLHVNEPFTHRAILEEYHRILKPKGYLNIRFFNNNKGNPSEPIFSVAGDELYMPVYGFAKPIIHSLISNLYSVEDYYFDAWYGATGHGCHNYVLARID